MFVSVAPLVQRCTSPSVADCNTKECGNSEEDQEGLGEAEVSSLEHHHLDGAAVPGALLSTAALLSVELCSH